MNNKLPKDRASAAFSTDTAAQLLHVPSAVKVHALRTFQPIPKRHMFSLSGHGRTSLPLYVLCSSLIQSLQRPPMHPLGARSLQLSLRSSSLPHSQQDAPSPLWPYWHLAPAIKY